MVRRIFFWISCKGASTPPWNIDFFKTVFDFFPPPRCAMMYQTVQKGPKSCKRSQNNKKIIFSQKLKTIKYGLLGGPPPLFLKNSILWLFFGESSPTLVNFLSIHAFVRQVAHCIFPKHLSFARFTSVSRTFTHKAETWSRVHMGVWDEVRDVFRAARGSPGTFFAVLVSSFWAKKWLSWRDIWGGLSFTSRPGEKFPPTWPGHLETQPGSLEGIPT